MQTLTIQSVSENLPQVEALLTHFCDENRIANYSATIAMAVLQAVQNAMQHGNGSNPDKKVNICCGYCKGGVYFEVSDQGSGFDFNSLLAADISTPGTGTGLFIMRSLADRLTFSNGGSTVRMEFLIRGIDSEVAGSRQATLQKFFAPRTVSV